MHPLLEVCFSYIPTTYTEPLATNHQHIFPKRPVFKISTAGPVLFSPEGDENLSNLQQPVHPRPVNYDISEWLVYPKDPGMS